MSVTQPIPITKLIEALVDHDTPFSPRYLYRLSDLEPSDADRLAKAWPNVSVRRREALLEDLEELHLEDVVQNFEAVARIGLKDEVSGVRIRAISILREYELVDLMPTYMDMAEHDPSPEVRAAATAALGTFVYMGEVEDISSAKLEHVEEFLLRLVDNDDTELVHRRAVEALGFSSRKEVPPLIEKAYASKNSDWQITALFAMGRSANSRWNSRVLKMLDHTKPDIRAEAAGAAGELEIADAKPALFDLLQDSDLDVRMAAAWSLSQIGGSGVREALESQLESTDLDEEAEHLEASLENLEFTDEMRNISLMEIPEDGDESDPSSEDDFDAYDDDLFSEDGKD